MGGIPTSITEDEFKNYFAKFGKVVEHQIMRDRSNGCSRGFGFVTFDSEQVVDEIISQGKMIELGGKQVEIKKAEPKKPLPHAVPIYGIHSMPPYLPGGVGGFRDSHSGYGRAGYARNPYRSAGGYGARPGGYAGYGSSEYGRAYGGYEGGSLEDYDEDASRGYGGYVPSYEEGFGGYSSGVIGGYGGRGRGDGYGLYADRGYAGSFESRVGGACVGGAYGSGKGAYGVLAMVDIIHIPGRTIGIVPHLSDIAQGQIQK